MITNCERCQHHIDKNPTVVDSTTPQDDFLIVKSCRFNHKQERLGFIIVKQGDCPDFVPIDEHKKPPSRFLISLELLLIQTLQHDLATELIRPASKHRHLSLTPWLTKKKQPDPRTSPSSPSAQSPPTPQPSPHTCTP